MAGGGWLDQLKIRLNAASGSFSWGLAELGNIKSDRDQLRPLNLRDARIWLKVRSSMRIRI